MAKENIVAPKDTEKVLESPVTAAPAETTKRKEETHREVSLKYGECIVAPVNSPEDEILTTISDWNSLYNAGKNAGKFVLKAEKKS